MGLQSLQSLQSPRSETDVDLTFTLVELYLVHAMFYLCAAVSLLGLDEAGNLHITLS